MELLVHWAALALDTPDLTVRPATTVPSSQVCTLPSVPRRYSKHVHFPLGRAVDVAMPWGLRSGRVASSVSRLYMRILDWPPMRRCFLAPWAESGMVMKETWASVSALVALLQF